MGYQLTGTFTISCTEEEAFNIMYNMMHDKALYMPELALINARPSKLDPAFLYPRDMFINGDYLFCYPKQQLALQIKQLLATHQIAFAQVLAATDKEDQHRIRAVFRQDLTKIVIDLHGVKEANAKKLILKYKRTPEER